MDNEQNIKRIYEFLTTAGCTPQGAAGMVGNIYAESRCNPRCVEALLLQYYKEDHFLKWNYGVYDNRSYDQYWTYIQEGAITEKEFLSPRSYTGKVHQFGAGICQWTTRDRKKKWLSLAKDDKKPLYDLDLQLNLLYYELHNTFPTVWRVLSTSINVLVCSNYVLHNFESPKNATSQEQKRYEYSMEVYNLCHKERTTMPFDPQKVINIAKDEVGYMEKKSNSQLDSKTANAGRGNFTKYWRDLKPSFQGQAWCDCFVDWCFQKAYGAAGAQKLECGGYLNFYTPGSAQAYKDAGRFDKKPKIGDQIFFKNASRIHHTGLVYGVSNGRVYTIEGNTSNGTAVVPNGGAVCMKSYSTSNKAIAGYGHPRYYEANVAAEKPKENRYMFDPKNFKQGDKNTSVLLFQEVFNAKNAWYKWGQPNLNLDWDAGPKTMANVEWYKKQRKISEVGCGPKTWKDLIAI